MPDFSTVKIRLKKGDKAPGKVNVYWKFTAPGPISLPADFFQQVTAPGMGASAYPSNVLTDKEGVLDLPLPTFSALANAGIEPATLQIRIDGHGIQHEIAVPDDECFLTDLIGAPAPDLPVVEPVFRSATRWLPGEGLPLDDTGRDGDWYADTLTTNVYIKRDGAWEFLFQMGAGGNALPSNALLDGDGQPLLDSDGLPLLLTL